MVLATFMRVRLIRWCEERLPVATEDSPFVAVPLSGDFVVRSDFIVIIDNVFIRVFGRRFSEREAPERSVTERRKTYDDETKQRVPWRRVAAGSGEAKRFVASELGDEVGGVSDKHQGGCGAKRNRGDARRCPKPYEDGNGKQFQAGHESDEPKCPLGN